MNDTKLDTLIIKNISPKLSYDEREDLLAHFGAKTVTNSPNYSYAVFETESQSREAMTRLHQLLVLGQRLRVEFATNCHRNRVQQLPPVNEPHRQQKSHEESAEALKEIKLRAFLNQLNYVSPALGLNYLPSPLLRYSYPTASPLIVNNIAHTLLSHPRFYTQVLHLMNKMNLPVPFHADPINRPNLLTFPAAVASHTIATDMSGQKRLLVCSSESELEVSDTEDNLNAKAIVAKPPKRVKKKLRTGFVGEKAVFVDESRPLKRQPKPKPSSESLPDVFEVPLTCEPKFVTNIAVNIVSDCRSMNELADAAAKHPIKPSVSGFGVMSAQQKQQIEKCVEIVWDKNNMITDEELAANRLLKSQWIKYPVFKNYSSGQTSIRLYVKNIDKSVETNDLMRIYGKYVDWESDVHRNMFDIRLMKTGRMKGQAFITLPDETFATKALNETNGYLFNDKPIVVSFARSIKPKETESLK
ncbi:unnamed protein product [Medioppia subpectinata]|uniref:RNA-binding region-containing protein 3 n=1 Tax=Medioppia subpectinata TaxID=1979941 RepID=A0A7R9KTC0_9ACAR|nr:unnamed protein product [Medioppia subpectinata]CAG2109139.1 unnamed protein product [Medioppia subpectinata]